MKIGTFIRNGSISAAALLAASCGQQVSTEAVSEADKNEIGSTLNNKEDVDVSQIPDGVIQVAIAARPDLKITGAEREEKNGVVYFDVAGITASGDEIELDIVQDGDHWRVVEIQRDIKFEDVPQPVRDALIANAPGITPDRIIESDQTDGVIIYEFFTRDEAGEETKYEVKYTKGEAVFLTNEWAH